MSTIDTEQRHAFEIFPKRDVAIVRGSGASLWDDRGREFIDCASGVGVANVGHAHPAVAEAIAEQSKNLITCPSIFYNDVRAKLMEKLVAISPAGLERVFLCNSGTEANEAAIKFARHATGRHHFVSAMRGFHGRTMGALSATHKYRDSFEPLLPGFHFVPFNNVKKLDAAVTEETAGVILEVVQGEGGVRPASTGFLAAARRICSERGALLIVDEVQTGFCRTGRMFGCDHFDLEPDLMCLAKAMGGGMPIGAVLASAAVEATVGIHGSTYGGNPLACAASLATIEVMETQQMAGMARAGGEYFRERFQRTELPKVRELRQVGLMIGIELKEKARPHLESLMQKGVLALPAGPTVIRLLPPLVITEEQIDAVVDALHATLSA